MKESCQEATGGHVPGPIMLRRPRGLRGLLNSVTPLRVNPCAMGPRLAKITRSSVSLRLGQAESRTTVPFSRPWLLADQTLSE